MWDWQLNSLRICPGVSVLLGDPVYQSGGVEKYRDKCLRPNIPGCRGSACRSHAPVVRPPRGSDITSLPRSLQWKVFWFLELIPGSYSGRHPLPRVSAPSILARRPRKWPGESERVEFADLFDRVVLSAGAGDRCPKYNCKMSIYSLRDSDMRSVLQY